MTELETRPAEANMEDTFVTADYRGNLVYYNLVFLSVFCKMDVRLFPYDTHSCPARFLSFAYEGDAVAVFIANDSDSSETALKNNGVWAVAHYHFEEVKIKYPCCPIPYREVHFTMDIRRESGFYVLNVGIPTLLLSLTTLSVFLLHPECGEKISLCVNNVLAWIIFQQLLTMNMPPTGDQTPIVDSRGGRSTWWRGAGREDRRNTPNKVCSKTSKVPFSIVPLVSLA
ncbi:putative acetylcholine receptor subunit alpha-1-A [Apostichopus japonicus]|uniref:Putative acetylcholine receptor subunit alpha-1-A n=1 Tax=Stichopus japonicus TaxID=307972 RepID=A0A2G8KFR3_STIJA|nr:putative acetylcholine receptor subunit alpha-1-A [Apostichopus japonicus]